MDITGNLNIGGNVFTLGDSNNPISIFTEGDDGAGAKIHYHQEPLMSTLMVTSWKNDTNVSVSEIVTRPEMFVHVDAKYEKTVSVIGDVGIFNASLSVKNGNDLWYFCSY